MRLRADILLPVDNRELLATPEDKRWELLNEYLKKFTLALMDDRREIAKVVNFNDGRVVTGEAEGASGYIRVMDRFLIQHGFVSRTGTGTVDITFPVAFSSTNYRIVGCIRGIAEAFTGGQAVRFPPGDRATTGCKVSLQSLTDTGVITAEWIAIGTGK